MTTAEVSDDSWNIHGADNILRLIINLRASIGDARPSLSVFIYFSKGRRGPKKKVIKLSKGEACELQIDINSRINK